MDQLLPMEWFGKLIQRAIGSAVVILCIWGGYYVYHVYIKKDVPPGTNFFSAIHGVSDTTYGDGPQLPKQSFGTEYQYPFENGWPYQVVGVPGANALQTYTKLCKEGRAKGFWPIMLGDLDETVPKSAPQTLAQVKPVAAKILEASLLVPWQDHVNAVKLYEMNQDAEFAKDDPDLVVTDEMAKKATLEDLGPRPEIWAHLNPYENKPLAKVYIAIIPSPKSYEAPAYLNWAGTDSTPSPDVSVAFLRSWNERFGAEVVAVMDNHLQIVVSRPPMTYEEALPLAYEHLAYDSYAMEDHYSDVRYMAQHLVGAKVWILSWE